MSEKGKKKVEKPEEIKEEKHEANAEGACTRITRSGCGFGESYSDTTSRGCGRITRSGCGFNESYS